MGTAPMLVACLHTSIQPEGNDEQATKVSRHDTSKLVFQWKMYLSWRRFPSDRSGRKWRRETVIFLSIVAAAVKLHVANRHV
jgi:hypothetical protein